MTDKPVNDNAPRKPFTGRHMAVILVAFFGVVVAVNITMAVFASKTFGGLVVENSYVASQKFNGWLEQAREQDALGWTMDAVRDAQGRLEVTMSSAGQPMTDAHVTALARHPLGRLPERRLEFNADGDGRYASHEALPAGRWIIHLDVKAHGETMREIVEVQ